MITKFQRCVGIKIPLGWRRQVEIWVIPPNECIPLHSHSLCHSRIFHICGNIVWTMGQKVKELTTRNLGWHRTVPCGVVHGAYSKSFAVFMNFESWSCTPTSAAIDFVRK